MFQSRITVIENLSATSAVSRPSVRRKTHSMALRASRADYQLLKKCWGSVMIPFFWLVELPVFAEETTYRQTFFSRNVDNGACRSTH
jgi:hypothetical protein